MSSFPGMRKLRITANDTKSLATKYSQAHFIYGNTEWFTAYNKNELAVFCQLIFIVKFYRVVTLLDARSAFSK